MEKPKEMWKLEKMTTDRIIRSAVVLVFLLMLGACDAPTTGTEMYEDDPEGRDKNTRSEAMEDGVDEKTNDTASFGDKKNTNTDDAPQRP